MYASLSPSTLQSSNSAGAESEALFGDKVLPGSAQELRDFGQEAIRKSACRVTCSLPYLLLAFPRKDVFDTIYCRCVAAVSEGKQCSWADSYCQLHTALRRQSVLCAC